MTLSIVRGSFSSTSGCVVGSSTLAASSFSLDVVTISVVFSSLVIIAALTALSAFACVFDDSIRVKGSATVDAISVPANVLTVVSSAIDLLKLSCLLGTEVVGVIAAAIALSGEAVVLSLLANQVIEPTVNPSKSSAVSGQRFWGCNRAWILFQISSEG